MSTNQWPLDRKFINGTPVIHRTSGRKGFVDGLLSNCPRMYCLDCLDGSVGNLCAESDLRLPTAIEWPEVAYRLESHPAEWPAAYDATGEREPPGGATGQLIDEYQMIIKDNNGS